MTVADLIKVLLEMDQQVISPRPSVLGVSAKLVAVLAEHAEPSLRRPDLMGDWRSVDLSSVERQAPRELDQPYLHLAFEVDRLTAVTAGLLGVCENLCIAYGMVRHESERPEWLREMMVPLRAAIRKATEGSSS